MIITNAFSLNMLPADMAACSIEIEEISVSRASHMAEGCVSAVGHADTAAVFSDVLAVHVPANRVTVTLDPGSRTLVGQYTGPRLPEGATTLPEGASIRWMVVEVK